MSPRNDLRHSLLRQGVRLEYFTVAYNLLEGMVAVGAGLAAGSVALIGFGLDSLIEIVAGVTLLWRLKRETVDEEDHTALEKRALLIVGITFFALALYILIEAGYDLIIGQEAGESLIGIILAAASLVIMPVLARAKTRVARSLGSRSLESEAKETWVCAYLSLVLLAGLLLNATLGWSWADPVAALAMLPFILKEGWEAVEEAREE